MSQVNQTLNLLFADHQCPIDQTGSLIWLQRQARDWMPCCTWTCDSSGVITAVAFAGDKFDINTLNNWTQRLCKVEHHTQVTRLPMPDVSLQLLGFDDPQEGMLLMALDQSVQIPSEKSQEVQQLFQAAGFVMRYVHLTRQHQLGSRRVRQLQSERLTLQTTYHQLLLDSLAEGTRQNEQLEQLVAERSSDLQEALIFAEHANEVKSKFLANMSHEIRTPLTAIMGYADLLHDADISGDMSEWVEILSRNSKHLLHIVNDILDLSKIESGKMPIERIGFNPNTIIEDVVEVMRPHAQQNNLPINIQYRTEIPAQIHSDPTRLRQILTNLLSNAIKFTDQGSITVRVSMIADQRKASQLQIEVVDTGIGMNEDQLKQIFAPFTQADVSTTRRFGGTGLGLTISRQLAMRMGGSLEVTSNLEVGSTFTLMIPDEASAQTPVIPREISEITSNTSDNHATTQSQGNTPMNSSSQSSLGTIRVLLAEDGPDNQRLITLVLKAANMHVDVAGNGQIAYDKAMQAQDAGQPYHVILMDMQMPVLDGLAATRQLRDAGYSRPIISLTANVMESDRKRCLDAGCNDFASKPIDRKQLVDSIVHYATDHAMQADKPQRTEQATDQSPLLSEWADDPDMAELVQEYVTNMPDRVSAISAALASEHLDDLRTLVHQIKGSAGGYGFDPISVKAGQVEMLVREQAELDRIRKEVDALVDLCNRASAG